MTLAEWHRLLALTKVTVNYFDVSTVARLCRKMAPCLRIKARRHALPQKYGGALMT